MKKLNLIFVITLLFPFFLVAQHFEVGVMLGGSTYMGDLVPEKKAISTGAYHYAGGVFIRYNNSEMVTTKLAMNYGNISADDANSSVAGRRARNLSFKSALFETSLTAEVNILGFDSKYSTRIFSPYVFMGISWFKFNPKAELNGVWVELQPLGTEGQGLPELPERQPYKLSGFSIPLGAGLKFALNDKINIGAEIGMRKTFTDYLDDVSHSYAGDDLLSENGKETTLLLSNRSGSPKTSKSGRGNSNQNDLYLFGGLTVSFNLNNSGLEGTRNKSRRGLSCPKF